MDEEGLVKIALRIVEEARCESLVLRVIGGVAARVHSEGYSELHKALGRNISELGFVSYLSQSEQLDHLMKRDGFEPIEKGEFRIMYAKEGVRAEVFLDRIVMNHVLEFKGRLEKDYPTAPLSELVLEDAQIVRIEEREIKDLIILFLAHNVGDGDYETINIGRISKVLAKDWGFYYTVKRNLKKVRNLLNRYPQLSERDKDLIFERIGAVLERIEREPKSLGWRLRSKIGTSKKWYI